jgi:hypothetical protein
MRRLIVAGAIAASLSVVLACPGSADVMTIRASEDAFVDSSGPDQNFGDVELIVGCFAPTFRSYLKFHLTALDPAAVIDQAALRLRMYEVNTQFWIAAYHVEDDTWLENVITWNNAPTEWGAATFVSQTPPDAEDWHVWDVTEDIRAIFPGDQVYSVALVAVNEGPPDRFAFYYPRHDDSMAKRPQLVITHRIPVTPVEPTSWGRIKSLYR